MRIGEKEKKKKSRCPWSLVEEPAILTTAILTVYLPPPPPNTTPLQELQLTTVHSGPLVFICMLRPDS